MKKIIDISEHNGYINFKDVKNSGIDVVIIRIGWIGNYNNHTIDKYFEEYYKQARLNDFKIGFYVYSYCETTTAILNACEWIYDKIKNKTFDLPIYLDLEDKQISNLSKVELTEQAIIFYNYFNKEFSAGVYASKYWFVHRLNTDLLVENNIKLWVAEWNGKENHTLNYNVEMWQYTNKGNVNGINTNVDLNYLYNDKNDENKGDYEMKKYRNGSIIEPVFADVDLKIPIGYLNEYEECVCFGIVNQRAIVVYNVDNSNNKKCGFVKYLGGIIN